MTETATSPLYHRPAFSARTATSAKTPSSSTMPPFLSTPRISTSRQRDHSPGNYFGFQAAADTNNLLSDSGHHSKSNWSPPSSTVRSTAAASPSVLPVDQNPEYDAFRKQSESQTSFNLNGLGGGFKMSGPPAGRPKHGRTTSKTSPGQPSTAQKTAPASEPRDMPPSSRPRESSLQNLDPFSAELSRSPKRMLSPGSLIEPTRRGSPASFATGEQDKSNSQARFSLPLDNANGPHSFAKYRAETLPDSGASKEPESQLMVTPQHIVNLIDSKNESILILDLRVSTQYAKSHISGALNLCIPTTLLKRPSFNVQKLADTFKDDEQRNKFENWRNSSYIIVYDTSSAQLKDAQICVNTINKFKSEGYEGTLYIVKGGFLEFSKRFPSHVEAGIDSIQASRSDGAAQEPNSIPVIGGCPMPSTDKPANPFFGNIRQNMDLIGGVGQIPLKHPSQAAKEKEKTFPDWLRKAADDSDQGKNVSSKFEGIEKREKKRMEDALSGKVSYGASTPQARPQPRMPGRTGSSVQIAGIEKGNKNRYNNIWPFEHSRVKLQGVPSHGCDYFNANYVQASWSHKRYISTQAPIPATFTDFWNVVWQQDVRVIVMLTAEKEGAQVKAHKYWDQKQYGPLRLEFLSEKRASIEPARIHKAQKQRPGVVKRSSTKSAHPGVPLAPIDPKEEKLNSPSGEQPYVIVRKFTLSHQGYPFEPMREITQLQYSSWPDFGAPAHPAHLLGLVEQTDAVVRATQHSHTSKEPEPSGERPIIVHCSAGCGRTGTFCTVDSVIDMLKRQRISKKQRQSRQNTPMEVDEHERTAAKLPHEQRHAKTHSKIEGSQRPSTTHRKSSESSFFASQTASQNRSDQKHDDAVEGEWIDDEEVDLVEKTVEDFRHQRLSMVQSLRQYVLCYESVMEWLAEQSPDSEASS